MILLLVVAAIFLIDMGIKDTIENTETENFPKELEGTKGLVMLHKNHNEGFPFGALKEKQELVKQVPFGVVSAAAGIFAWLYPRKGHQAEKVGLALILGGGLSNLYDRMIRGYVVDYFSIQWKQLKKVVFNLGDICIFAGALVMLAAEIVESIRER